jgi:hypothetical protein
MALGNDLEALPLLHPLLTKRACPAREGFSAAPLPLRQIYVLAEGPIQEVAPLGPQEVLIELVRHTYGIRYLKAAGTSPHFLQCARLANQVPVRRLKTPRDLQSLAALARLVEEDVERGWDIACGVNGRTVKP